jgi:hypothetical protein
MKVKIGRYKSWIGPYQIADTVFFWHEKHPSDELSERWDYKLHDRFGDWLANDKNGDDSRITKFCQWLEGKRKRNIKVKIDYYDTWSMDHTLAHIIAPMLKQLNERKQGAPYVDDEDVPVHLRSTSAPPKENEWDIDANHFARWDWVMEEMIWAFEIHNDDGAESKFYDHSEVVRSDKFDDWISKIKVDKEGLDAFQKRKQNAFRLFGKYYQSLWD